VDLHLRRRVGDAQRFPETVDDLCTFSLPAASTLTSATSAKYPAWL
jgi:hypothetical protein